MLALLILLCATALAPAKQLGWKQLFDGKDLSGWQHVGPGSFIVEHGLLKTQGGMGLLYSTVGPMNDCEIKVVYKMEHENDNSGVFIRIPSEPTEPWMPVNRGYEVQIDNHPELSNEDEYHVTGTLYSLTVPWPSRANPARSGNTMRDSHRRPANAQVFVNDVKVTDYIEGQPVPDKKASYEPDRGPRPDKGWIGLQNHSDKDIVYFKTIEVLELGTEQQGVVYRLAPLPARRRITGNRTELSESGGTNSIASRRKSDGDRPQRQGQWAENDQPSPDRFYFTTRENPVSERRPEEPALSLSNGEGC